MRPVPRRCIGGNFAGGDRSYDEAMRIEQLQYLEAAIRTGSFRQAAKELGVAQPTITTQVQRLEEDLGVVLVLRSAQGVRATDAAERVLPHVMSAIRANHALRQEASSIDGLKTGSIRLATVTSASQTLLPKVVKRLHTEHPNIRFEVTEGGSEMVHQGVTNGEFDAGILIRTKHEVPDTSHLTFIDILEGRGVLAIPESHPLAQQDVVEPKDLTGQPLIFHRDGALLRIMLDRFIDGVETRAVYFTDNSSTAQSLVREGVGISIANTLAPLTTGGEGIVLSPLRRPWAEICLSGVVRRDEMRGAVVQTFLGLLRQEAATYPTRM